MFENIFSMQYALIPCQVIDSDMHYGAKYLYGIIRCLLFLGLKEIKLVDLMEHMGVTRPTILKYIDMLVKHNFIEVIPVKDNSAQRKVFKDLIKNEMIVDYANKKRKTNDLKKAIDERNNIKKELKGDNEPPQVFKEFIDKVYRR